MEKMVKIERTAKGLPAMWEEGGGFTNTGFATIITDRYGGRKSPLYVRKRGELACGRHALFFIRPGDFVIECNHHRGDFTIEIYKIYKIPIEGDMATLWLEGLFKNGEWHKEPPKGFEKAIETAKAKATEWHCRRPMYCKGGD